jgi:hypothetical protein
MTQVNMATSSQIYAADNRAEALEPIPAVVCLDVFGVSGAAIAGAVSRMSIDRMLVRKLPGVTFAKLLGTGSGRTFTTRDADPGHWAILTCWTHPGGPTSFERSSSFRAWSTLADEHARFLMLPLVSRGSWAHRQPFGDPLPHRWDGPIAAITRARIKTRHWRTFWQAVPPVSHDLHAVPGLDFAMGIGEAPVGLQGTFSVWSNGAALSNFAHRRSPHREVMEKTYEIDWYAEELFARFALVDARGTYNGVSVRPQTDMNDPDKPTTVSNP